jgi:hypothetical protein
VPTTQAIRSVEGSTKTRISRTHTRDLQEYELADDEVKISLDRFRDEYCSPDGSVK